MWFLRIHLYYVILSWVLGSPCSVQTPSSSCSTGQHTTVGIPVTASNGYLSSLVADSTGCGRSRSPWLLSVQRGQTIRMILYDFGIHYRTKSRTAHDSSVTMTTPSCVLYAILREPLSTTTHNISICGGLQRHTVVYTSSTHRLEVAMVHGDQGNHIPHYLLQHTG